MTAPKRSTPSNWDRWGPDDERGAVNLLTPAKVLRACEAVATGRIYELGIEVRPGAPVGGSRISPLHFMSHDGGDFAALGRDDWGTADDYVIMATQGTTHVDGLAHMWYGGELYNGFSYREVRSTGAAKLGVEKLGGMITTAHVLDFAELAGRDVELEADALDEKLRTGGSVVTAGDAILIRTGWMDAALQGDLDAKGPFPVLSPSVAEWVAAHDIAILGADNVAIERTAKRGELPPLHAVLVRDLGVTLMELLTLRQPAEDGVTSGLLIVAPLRISRGVGSPANPLLVA